MDKTDILWILLAVVFHSVADAQEFSWVNRLYGPGQDGGNGIAISASGDLYITGHFSGKLNLDDNTRLNGFDGYEIFLAKFSGSGQLIWARHAGGRGSDKAEAIALDSGGNVYISGYFEDTAWFENQMVISHGGRDIFLAKYDDNGVLQWVTAAGGKKEDAGKGITVTPAGVWLTGKVMGSKPVFDGDTVPANGGFYADAFVALYGYDGHLRWAKALGGSQEDQGSDVAVLTDGSVVVTGFFSGTATFVDKMLTSAGNYSPDAFVVRIDSAGNCIWAKRGGGIVTDASHAVAVDPDNNIYITGYYAETATFGNHQIQARGYNDVFIAKYLPNGDCQWVRSGGGDDLDVGLDIAVDASGNIYATGFFDAVGNARFENTVLQGDEKDIFIARYSPSGQLDWITTAGGGNGDYGKALAADESTVYLTGWYFYTCWLGTNYLDRADNADIFLSRIAQPATTVNAIHENNTCHFQLALNNRAGIQVIPVDGNCQPAAICLYDMSGREIMNTPWQNGLNQIELPDTFKNGIYMLVIKGYAFQRMYKLVLVN